MIAYHLAPHSYSVHPPAHVADTSHALGERSVSDEHFRT
jgi:hypothetical protein